MSQHRSLKGSSKIQAKRNVMKRFERVERLAKQAGVDVRTAGRDTLEQLWVQAKVEEKRGKDN